MKHFAAASLRPALQGKKVLLCISGSIAAFKACDLIRGLKECGAQVRVAATESALQFVTKTTLETLSGFPALSSLWDDSAHGTHHIEVSRWADAALVAPATANLLAKLALGLADDLVSTELLAFRGPLLVAPAMNPAMYEHPAVQENVAKLKSRGACLLGPCVGKTACGEEGLGRMLESDEIVEALAMVLGARGVSRRKIVINLGPTRSALDPVRYLTNRSSGAMGAALAWAAALRGHEVTVVAGPTNVELPRAAKVIRVETAEQMREATLKSFAPADALIACAAVLDWNFKAPSSRKLKKDEGAPHIEFTLNPDILAEAGRLKKPTQFILGFAAETEPSLEAAREKLKRKKVDAIFLNDVSKAGLGFESPENAGWWVTPDQSQEFGPRSKVELGQSLIELVEGECQRCQSQKSSAPIKSFASGAEASPQIKA